MIVPIWTSLRSECTRMLTSRSASSSGSGGSSIHPSAVLFVTMIFGMGVYLGSYDGKNNNNNNNNHLLEMWFSWSNDVIVETWIIPLYTIVSILYITLLAFRQSCPPVLRWIRQYTSSSYAKRIQRQQRRKLAHKVLEGSQAQEQQRSALEQAQKAEQEATPSSEEKKEEGEGEFAGEEGSHQPVDLTGVYRLVSNVGFDEFLQVQGVPWALRAVACKATPVHRITHRGRTLTIRIEGTPIVSQTTYVINGPPVETNVRGRIFADTVEYLDDGRPGIIVKKTAITENYDVTVQRVLSEDKQTIHVTSTAYFKDDENKPNVVSKQVFVRINEEEQ